MAESLSQDDRKAEHKELAAFIKGVHKKLRRQYRESGDYQSVWAKHSQDKNVLKAYADAMKCLAEKHWSIYPETRVDWCFNIIKEYFLQDGLKSALEKDAKREFYKRQRRQSTNASGGQKENEQQQQSCQKTNVLLEEQELLHHSVAFSENPELQSSSENSHTLSYHGETSSNFLRQEDNAENRQTDPWNPQSPCPMIPAEQHQCPKGIPVIRLLDVGSCYNPFKECPHIQPLAIDLCPAHPSVYQCDFLKLRIVPASPDLEPAQELERPSIDEQTCQRLPLSTSSMETLETQDLEDSLGIQESHKLPEIRELSECSFEVVVFSLLLEYLPSPSQRAQSCLKAIRLLRPNGLLLIITPDSKSAYKNSPMMNSWRTALERVGLVRWRYHKMEHIHCMAFRKVSPPDNQDWSHLQAELSPYLFIPQDFSQACYHDDACWTDQGEARGQSSSPLSPQEAIENETFCSLALAELPLT